VLQIKNLEMSAGNFSINNISLSVPDGCCHVLLGRTGNGKTLILESIAGLRPIKNGDISIDNRIITKEPSENKFISYVPQDLALFPHLNVEKNIFYSQRFKRNQSRDRKEISEIIERLQLGSLLHRSIHNLSGGEQQRVALARAFASGNKVLLLDEPYSALHFTMKRTLWSLLSDIKRRYTLSILMVTHDLEEAFFLADNISVLHRGMILQTGKNEDVFSNPANIEVTKITGHYNYFSGNVVSINGEQCLVYFDKLCNKFTTKNVGFTPGDKVIMAIRTSNIEILPKGDKTIPACSTLSDAHNTISCKIKNIHYTTHYQQLVVTVEQQDNQTQDEVFIDVYDKKSIRNFEIGQKVTVSFPKDAIIIFKDDIN